MKTKLSNFNFSTLQQRLMLALFFTPLSFANNSNNTIGDIGKNVADTGADILGAILTWSTIISIIIAIAGLLILTSKNQQSQAEKKYAWGMILGGGALSGVLFLLAISQNTLFGSGASDQTITSVIEQSGR